MVSEITFRYWSFQSTRPSRGETYVPYDDFPAYLHHFNPLAPRGARLTRKFLTDNGVPISIHSPLAGRDSAKRLNSKTLILFQSTRPSRGETTHEVTNKAKIKISIHSPLAGRDRISSIACISFGPNFNPLAPRGARQALRDKGDTGDDFNPLAPRGARRHSWMRGATPKRFQSTRPSRGETGERRDRAASHGHFNPLAPRGARPGGEATHKLTTSISIHSPLAGRDACG